MEIVKKQHRDPARAGDANISIERSKKSITVLFEKVKSPRSMSRGLVGFKLTTNK
jgi:hypothetical protein